MSCPDDKTREAIGGRLAAAWISYKLGIGLEYAYKTYVKGRPVGEDWTELADAVWDVDVRKMNAHAKAIGRIGRDRKVIQ